MYKVRRHQYLSKSLWSGERDKGRERTFSHFFAQLVIWQLIFVISDRSICLKLTIRFLRLNFCQAWKLLKSLKNHCTDSWQKQRSQNYFSQKKTKHILFCRNDQNSKKEDVEEHCKTASDFWFLNISSCNSKCITKYFKILEKRIICVVRPRFQDRFWCFKRRYFYHILPIRPNMTIEDAQAHRYGSIEAALMRGQT